MSTCTFYKKQKSCDIEAKIDYRTLFMIYRNHLCSAAVYVNDGVAGGERHFFAIVL